MPLGIYLAVESKPLDCKEPLNCAFLSIENLWIAPFYLYTCLDTISLNLSILAFQFTAPPGGKEEELLMQEEQNCEATPLCPSLLFPILPFLLLSLPTQPLPSNPPCVSTDLPFSLRTVLMQE